MVCEWIPCPLSLSRIYCAIEAGMHDEMESEKSKPPSLDCSGLIFFDARSGQGGTKICTNTE